MYSCRLYKNSGFNASNIPDDITLLGGVQFIDVAPLDILQDKLLRGISVKATWAQVEDVDYAHIGDMLYFVTGITMTSTDVAQLSILPDFLTTAGLSNLSILDGVTERVHVAKTDDTFGAFPEEDELMAPVHPMKLVSAWTGYERVYGTFIETVLDLEAMATSNNAVTFTDSTSGETVTVPATVAKDGHTAFKMNDGTTDRTSDTTCTKVYRLLDGSTQQEDVTLKEGIDIARGLGIENGGIIRKARLPLTQGSGLDQRTTISEVYDANSKGLASLTSSPIEYTTQGLAFIFSNAANAKINYSAFTQYGIMTAAGEKMEVDASTIYDYQNPTTEPHIIERDDPHLDGAPYYRFKFINEDSSFEGFWRNCVKGLPWKNVPVVMTEKSGSILDTLNYNMDASIRQDQRDFERIEQRIGVLGSSIGAGVGIGTAAATGNLSQAVGGIAGLASSVWDAGKSDILYRDERLKAAQQFALSQNVVQPTIQFPFNAETVRDFMGNGLLVYRYIYDQYDEQRIDKLLSLYGYKHTKALENSDFFNRSNFNYVLASNVSFTGAFPKWMLDGCAQQIQGGVRIWHMLPNTNAWQTNV